MTENKEGLKRRSKKAWREEGEEREQREEWKQRKEREEREQREELRQKCRRLRKEEEEEDREISLYHQRLEYMLDDCSEYDRNIHGLIEDQQGMLNALCMSRREFLDEADNYLHTVP